MEEDQEEDNTNILDKIAKSKLNINSLEQEAKQIREEYRHHNQKDSKARNKYLYLALKDENALKGQGETGNMSNSSGSGNRKEI